MFGGIFQVYTVHVRANQRVLACIYGILPKKNQNTTFNRVAAIGNPPTSMIFDSEVAPINSFSEIFPNTNIRLLLASVNKYTEKKIRK